MTENKDALQEIEKILRQHIKVDATGLAPMVARAFVTGFDDAAEAISAWNARATPPTQDAMREAMEKIASCESHHPGDVVAIARTALSAPNVAGEWTTLESVRTAAPYDDCLGVHVEATALSTPQPESVEAAVERVTYAIILGSSGERAADHAKEFQTANWEDARRSAIAVIKAMPAENTQPGPGSWVPADQFVTLRHERDGLRAALAEAIEALKEYKRDFCEGLCDGGPHFNFDCSGCRAAQVVAKHGDGRS